MFKKLNFDFNSDTLKKVLYLTKYIDKQTCELYGDPSPDGYNAITDDENLVIDYYHKNNFCKFLHYSFNYDPITKYFPFDRIKEKPVINWQVVTGGYELPPHVDLKRKCAINFYINTNNETTSFYTRKRQGVFLKEKHNKYVSNELFIPDWVEKTDSFIANDFDVYILDTTKPHSVLMNNNQNKRIAITFSFFEMTYENVLQCLEN